MGETNQAKNTLAVAAAVVLSLLLLAGCLEADTLGQEPFDEIVIAGTPTWSNGVGELMQLKCAVCHSVPPGSVSPATTPADLDLNVHLPYGSVRGAVDTLPFLAADLLRAGGGSSGVRQMPLIYATPLTAAEITALEAWDGS